MEIQGPEMTSTRVFGYVTSFRDKLGWSLLVFAGGIGYSIVHDGEHLEIRAADRLCEWGHDNKVGC